MQYLQAHTGKMGARHQRVCVCAGVEGRETGKGLQI